MKRLFLKGLLASGVMAVCPSFGPLVFSESAGVLESDPRLTRLAEFFEEKDAPLQSYTVDFLRAADTNDLDWRLLPSIAFVESSGGKQYKNNNIFGWDNCNQRFRSIRHGIYQVASRLSQSKLYRDKDTRGILRTYNPNAEYSARVLRVMRSISPAEMPQPVAN